MRGVRHLLLRCDGMRIFKQMIRLSRDPRLILCLASLLLYLAVLRDCHFCLYLRTPWGVASFLIVASLLMWLGRLGYVLGVVISSLAFCLAAFNVLKERGYAIDDYGPAGWSRVAFMMSWGYLLGMLLAAVISWYGVAKIRRNGSVARAR
jgi:hypothetical protein